MSLTTILIKNLRVETLIGVYEHEKQAPQALKLDLELRLDARRAAFSDALSDTIDYDEVCASVNRSTYAAATSAAMRVLETREQLCALFGFGDPTHVIFTPGQTVSLNLVIKGLLHTGKPAAFQPARPPPRDWALS